MSSSCATPQPYYPPDSFPAMRTFTPHTPIAVSIFELVAMHTFAPRTPIAVSIFALVAMHTFAPHTPIAVFIFALVGMSLFGSAWGPEVSRFNFNTFADALLLSFHTIRGACTYARDYDCYHDCNCFPIV
jgi:hypothetical protein